MPYESTSASKIRKTERQVAGRIIKDEQDEVVEVTWATYMMYFKLAGGWKLLVPLNIMFALYIGSTVMANFVLQQWAYADPEVQ